MSEQKPEKIEQEVLVEKVREIETAKSESETFDAKTSDENNTAKILNEKRELSAAMTEDEAKKKMGNRSRRTFLIGGVTALAGIFGWRSLSDEQRNSLFERTFRFNKNLSQTTFDKYDLVPEFPNAPLEDRINGMIGLGDDFDASNWRLQVTGLSNPQQFPQYSENISFEGENNAPRSLDTPPAPNVATPGLLFTLDDIKSLPSVEMTTKLKCIEGWSIIVNWKGVRFSDFAAQFFPVLRQNGMPNLQNIPETLTKYVSLVTPDRAYYVGWDMQSILHPQTLLAYEMNGAPLTSAHGAPLRLVTTTKYGIKQLKRIGRIEFTNEYPADYWAERGYDWYSGH
ncbi:MAG TPA: molybdopterin-dependent oxidoreductase [Pyrinomonadaceae bacterium]|nr:molybdopterin-dependent oxidoreductase [Pyrinomonadaceae bacterium]